MVIKQNLVTTFGPWLGNDYMNWQEDVEADPVADDIPDLGEAEKEEEEDQDQPENIQAHTHSHETRHAGIFRIRQHRIEKNNNKLFFIQKQCQGRYKNVLS